jgi:hypothetical protein
MEERSSEMLRTLQRKVTARLVLAALGCMLVAGVSNQAAGQARVGSDEPAALVIFPKIIVDTSGVFTDGRVDTLIQLTNTDNNENNSSGSGTVSDPRVADGSHYVNCWYVNANSFCSTDLPSSTSPGTQCRSNADCATQGGVCTPLWRVNDFQLLLTPSQPIAWRVSEGLNPLPCYPPTTGPLCRGGLSALGSIPPVEDPFQGELKCVVVDEADIPQVDNVLKGEGTIYRAAPGVRGPETSTYSAIGVQGHDVTPLGNNVLCLGQSGAGTSGPCTVSQYAGCPASLSMTHYFDGATLANGTQVVSQLTLVPCSQNFEGGAGSNLIANQTSTTAQMLVYNEFEQRFSTSRQVACWDNVLLSDIDTREGESDNAWSVFAVGVQGTLGGQTRIRGVETAETVTGHGLLAIVEEGYVPANGGGLGSGGFAAFQVDYIGERAQRDVIRLSLPLGTIAP